MAARGLTSPEDRAKMTAIYGLGPTPSDAAVDALTLSFITPACHLTTRRTSSAFYAWATTGTASGNMSRTTRSPARRTPPPSRLIQDAWALGRSATNETFDKYVLDRAGRGMNESERTQLRTIYSWGPAPDRSVIRDYVLNEAAKDLNETESKLIREVYVLGRDASNASLQNYTISTINEDLGLKGNMSYLYALLAWTATPRSRRSNPSPENGPPPTTCPIRASCRKPWSSKCPEAT